MKKLRVTHVISGLDTGGAEMMLLKLVAATSERIQHSVVSLRDIGTIGGRLEELGAEVHGLGIKVGASAIARLPQLSGLISDLQPSVTQGWMYHGNVALALSGIAARVRRRMVWSIRCTVDAAGGEKALTRAIRNGGALLSRLASTTIYNSERSRSQHEALGYARNGIVIGNGFDLDRFDPRGGTKQSARAKLGLPSGELTVLMIAREDPMKDYESYLRSAVIVHRVRQDVNFVAVGRGVPDLSRRSAECNSAIQELGPKFYGFAELKDVVPPLRAADIFVLSSAWGEAFPNVVGEAMALGLPCVATDVGDCREIVGDAGFVVPPRSPDALAESILNMLREPESYRAGLGARARARIQERYSIAAVASCYEGIWRGTKSTTITDFDRAC